LDARGVLGALGLAVHGSRIVPDSLHVSFGPSSVSFPDRPISPRLRAGFFANSQVNAV
jgi:hypothetical protein